MRGQVVVGLLVVWLLVFLFVVHSLVPDEEEIWRGKGEGDVEKVNGVFVYLVSKEKSVEEAKGNSHPIWDYVGDAVVSLRYLHKNFNSRYQYPIVIFHDGLSEETQREIREKSGNASSFLTFEEITFDFPASLALLSEEEKEKLNGFSCTKKPWHLDYLHMNRFFVLNLFKHPYLKQFDVYFRLDTDLFVKQKIDFDLFGEMVKREAEFVYWNDATEREGCVQGLGDAVNTYLKDNNFENIPKINPRLAYHGCFGGGQLSFFRSEQYQNFADYLNELGGIYYHRWADQVIYRIAFKIFGKENKVQKWKHLGRYLQHNKRYPEDLCSVVPNHHKCGRDGNGQPYLVSDSLKLEPRHSGSYGHVYPKYQPQEQQEEL